MPRPDFVVVGHVVRDVVPGGWRLGGTVTFAAVQAHRLGLAVGVVTAAAADFDVATHLAFADVVRMPGAATTSFENVYVVGGRRQRVLSRADAITATAIPDHWAGAPIVLLGPVLEDIPPDLRSRFAWESLCGVSAQGWLRRVGAEGHVEHTAWRGAPFWPGCDVLFVSDEDLAGDESMLKRWSREVPIVAMTESCKGARVHAHGSWRRIDAFPEAEVDPTGAGDTFATALLVRLRETGDVYEAARFGAAAASISVAGVGAESIPSREEIEERLRAYPEVVLR